MSRLLMVIVALIALGSAACAASTERGTSPGPVPPQAPSESKGGAGGDRDSFATGPTGSTLPAERVIIRNGQMTLVVADLNVSIEAVLALAQEVGGFVVSSNRSGEEASAFAQITIRVPADRFEGALSRLRALAVRTETETINSQDVTEEFIDLEARLRNLKATEQQFINLLDRAQTVEDVLKVQRELTSVRTEIERIQGRLQFLEQSSAFSLITVMLRPAASPEPIVNPRWDVSETTRDAIRSLVETSQGLATLGIWMAVFAPLWVPAAGVLAWLSLRRRRRPRPGPVAAPGTP